MNIEKLYECMEIKKVNNSLAREAIYSILSNECDCMSVADIANKLKNVHPRKVSLNTIYRHLMLFTECGLVIVLQDDLKKAYYCLVGEKAKVFTICPKCNQISTLQNKNDLEKLLNTLVSSEFITIHKKCSLCK